MKKENYAYIIFGIALIYFIVTATKLGRCDLQSGSLYLLGGLVIGYLIGHGK
jgi:hypothetical protein